MRKLVHTLAEIPLKITYWLFQLVAWAFLSAVFGGMIFVVVGGFEEIVLSQKSTPNNFLPIWAISNGVFLFLLLCLKVSEMTK